MFLTVHEDQDFVDAAFSAGASAYVTKSQLTTDLIPAIHELYTVGDTRPVQYGKVNRYRESHKHFELRNPIGARAVPAN